MPSPAPESRIRAGLRPASLVELRGFEPLTSQIRRGSAKKLAVIASWLPLPATACRWGRAQSVPCTPGAVPSPFSLLSAGRGLRNAVLSPARFELAGRPLPPPDSPSGPVAWPTQANFHQPGKCGYNCAQAGHTQVVPIELIDFFASRALHEDQDGRRAAPKRKFRSGQDTGSGIHRSAG